MITPLDLSTGYRYTPERGTPPIEIMPANPSLSTDELFLLAREFQGVIHESWASQLIGFTSEQIGLTASPDNEALVRAQMGRLRDANMPDKPGFVYANGFYTPSEGGAHVIGIGKALEIPRKKHWGVERSGLADVSNIFVQPSEQARGVGSAILHTLLNIFPGDARTTVYDFGKEVNPRTVETLKRWGFTAVKSWREYYFGDRVKQVWYGGPSVGELREAIERRRKWLKDREQFEIKPAA